MASDGFVPTEEHFKLLRAAYWSRSDMYAGAPGMNPKRPFGNSCVECDMAEILGYDLEEEGVEEHLWSVWEQLTDALTWVIDNACLPSTPAPSSLDREIL